MHAIDSHLQLEMSLDIPTCDSIAIIKQSPLTPSCHQLITAEMFVHIPSLEYEYI